MVAARVYLCHVTNNQSQHDVQVLNQLRNRLQEIGTEVIIQPGFPTEQDLLSFLEQQLPICQWFILFQTPTTLYTQQVQLAVKKAQKLVEQQRLQGLLRIVSTADDDQEAPEEWSAMTTFDATLDYTRAIEKALLAVSAKKTSIDTARSPSPPVFHTGNVMSTNYDRPPTPPSAMSMFKITLQNMDPRRKKLLIVLVALLIITLIGSTLGFLALNRTSSIPPKAGPQLYGFAYFSSTGFLGAEATKGTADGLDIRLQHLKMPAKGESYYAWLLPDKSNFRGPTLLIGRFTPENGSAHIIYQSPTHDNLLATDSRFLVTEESAAQLPEIPTADKSKWRYYGELPQVANPNDPDHFSDLDHLRHLLADDSTMDMGMLKGGLGIWFLQNVRKLTEWSSSARGAMMPDNPELMHRHFLRILDYLDGTDLVYLDVGKGAPFLVDPRIARTPLLIINPGMMKVGYVHDIEIHLLALSNSPLSTKGQQTLAGQIDVELNKTRVVLERIRVDTKQLVKMNNAQLLDHATIPLLDDLVTQTNIALSGRVDPATSTRHGGANWIFDHMQQLAQFTVVAQ